MHAINLLLILSLIVAVVGGAVFALTSWRTYWHQIAGWTGGIAAVAAFFLGIGSGAMYVETKACETQANELGRDFRYGLTAECRVETPGGFVPIDNYRLTDEERGKG